MHNVRSILYSFSHEIPSSRILPSISENLLKHIGLASGHSGPSFGFSGAFEFIPKSASQCCFSCVYFSRRVVFSDLALLISE
jgi:hypothetical protein